MKKLSLTLFCACSFVCYAQEKHGMGLLPDDGTYDKLPTLAARLTRDFYGLPVRHSLKKYCPKVKSQSQYGTCVGWSTVYAARTIAEAVNYGWTSTDTITEEAFSPLFVYAQIKNPLDSECEEGCRISDALGVLKTKGCVKYNHLDQLCVDDIPDELFQEALQYRIDDYYTLFRMWTAKYDEKIEKTRKSISENHPVIIGMEIPPSFEAWNFTEWSGLDDNPDNHGIHAMCVVGYDDEKNGGSFYIMNSWGQDWGDDGFVWVRYGDFAKYVSQAYEMYVRKDVPKPIPEPQPEPIPMQKYRVAGRIELQLVGGEKMTTELMQKGGITYYQCPDTYIHGQQYRIFISSDEPCYLYLIGSDDKRNDVLLFPYNGLSPLLSYKSNHIAFPNDGTNVRMNEYGREYLCFLYSHKELDIEQILSSAKSYDGSFYERIHYAISDDQVPTVEAHYSPDAIGFDALSTKTIVPILIEMKIE